MKSGCVLLFILILPEIICCQGCWEHEREALLTLNARFKNRSPPWSADSTNCCEWEGVECNIITGRVTKLNLSGQWDYDKFGNWYLNYSDFIVFRDLKSLDLSFNYIASCVESEGLEILEILDLSGNRQQNDTSVLSCLTGFSSLKSLSLKSLYYVKLDISLISFPHVLQRLSSNLSNLEVLDLSNIYLQNDILPLLEGFTSLKELYLSRNYLDSDLHFPSLCSKLINLEVLDLSWNFFDEIDIVSALSGLSSLKSLNLQQTQMISRSICNISALRSLEILNLSENDLNESMIWCIENNGLKWPTNLQVLGLSNNSLSNKFIASLNGLEHIKSLDLKWTQLEGLQNICGECSYGL